jgi:hypothetical protein
MRRFALNLRGTVPYRSEASALLTSPGDAVLVERGRPRLLVMLCPCGCNEHLPINLDPRAGAAWSIQSSPSTGISIFPSVWRKSGCNSHFIVWRNRVFLFAEYDDEFELTLSPREKKRLEKKLTRALPSNGLKSVSELSAELHELPWDVLVICRELARRGLARQGNGTHRGSFGASARRLSKDGKKHL